MVWPRHVGRRRVRRSALGHNWRVRRGRGKAQLASWCLCVRIRGHDEWLRGRFLRKGIKRLGDQCLGKKRAPRLLRRRRGPLRPLRAGGRAAAGAAKWVLGRLQQRGLGPGRGAGHRRPVGRRRRQIHGLDPQGLCDERGAGLGLSHVHRVLQLPVVDGLRPGRGACRLRHVLLRRSPTTKTPPALLAAHRRGCLPIPGENIGGV
mmetsp:Transcript_58138/g.131739  ORF Transcript_58138/g.131739 Transcript_58138/m.131739 type:complete len:205 (-) Transcript_58138:236-850(-)